MDYRFKFSRKPPDEHEERAEQRTVSETKRRMRGLAIGMSIPASLVAGPVAGWLVGGWLDHHFGTGYWLIVLILLFTVASIYTVIELLISLGRE